MDGQKAELGDLYGAGVGHGNWQIWPRCPLCQSRCQEICGLVIVGSLSSNEICADVLHTDGCMVPSARRQISNHVLLPALVLNVEHQAGAGEAA